MQLAQSHQAGMPAACTELPAAAPVNPGRSGTPQPLADGQTVQQLKGQKSAFRSSTLPVGASANFAAPVLKPVSDAAKSVLNWLQTPPGQSNADPSIADPALQSALKESRELGKAVEQSRAAARARLEGVLKLYQAKLRPIEGDGNCQFRAISLQLYGDQTHHSSLRSRVVEQFRTRRDWYAPYVERDFDEYCESMEHDGMWGDNVSLQAACDTLGCEIRVLTDVPGSECVELHPTLKMTGATQQPLCLTFMTEVHYDAFELNNPI